MCDYAPFIGRGEVAEHTETLTEWMREIRRLCDQAAAEQGRPKRLVVRIGATLDGNKRMGMDVETWIEEGIVDALICMQVVGGFANDTTGLRAVVAAAEGRDVRVLAGMESTNNPELSRPSVRAAAANAYAAGVHGVFFHTYYPMPNRYPYDDEAAGRLRFMGHSGLAGQSRQAVPARHPHQSQVSPYPWPNRTATRRIAVRRSSAAVHAGGERRRGRPGPSR